MDFMGFKANLKLTKSLTSSALATALILGVGAVTAAPAHASGPATVNVVVSCTGNTNVTAAVGDTLSFSFAANCASAPAIQFFNWKSLGTRGFLDVTNRPAGASNNGGTWYLNATSSTTFSSDLAGDNGSTTPNVQDNIAMLTPDSNAATEWYFIKWLGAPEVPSATPTISTQPAGAALTVGDSLCLSVSATSPDGGTLSYAWNKDGQVIQGETGSTLSIQSVSVNDAGSYTVDVTNTHNSDTPVMVTSNAATVTVAALSATPTISTQPAGATLTVGDALELTVVAAASDGGTLSYAWKKNGQSIAGETTSSLSVQSVGLGDAGSYTVVVTNTHGSDVPVAVTSSAAVVAVSAAEEESGGSGNSGGNGEESQSSGTTSVKATSKSFKFASGSLVLSATAKKAIKALVKKSGTGAKYTITGSAGSIAGVPYAYTKNLAKLRAKAIKAYLVKLGVKKSSILIKSRVAKSGTSPKTKLSIGN